MEKEITTLDDAFKVMSDGNTHDQIKWDMLATVLYQMCLALGVDTEYNFKKG